MSKTVQEIIEYIEEKSADALIKLRDEPNHNSNHMATAYNTEFEVLEQLKEWIYS